MYIHLNSQQVIDPYVGVSIADSPIGPYRFVHAFKPDGQVPNELNPDLVYIWLELLNFGLNRQGSYDMTIYQDDDARAYLIRAVMNQYVGISLLSEDYLKVVELVSFIGGIKRRKYIKYTICINFTYQNREKDKLCSNIKEIIICGRHI